MTRWPRLAPLLLGATVACGGKLVPGPEQRVLPDASPALERDAGIDATAPDDAGPDATSDDVAVPTPDGNANAVDACAAIQAPRCVPAATCGEMYLRKGEGLETGYFRFETVDVPCASPPTVVQQWLDGDWKVLASLADVNDRPSLQTYILGSQFPLTQPQEGATVGSRQAIRGCTVTDSCTVCDQPTDITVLSCGACLPKKCGIYEVIDEACDCVPALCPCPADTFPACPTPPWVCFGG